MNKKYIISFLSIIFITTLVFSQQSKDVSKKSKKQVITQQTEEFGYELVFFDEETGLPKSVKRKTIIPLKTKKEEKVKTIVNDLLSFSDTEAKQKKVRKVIKPKIEVVDVKCSTETHKTLDNIEIHHNVVLIEFPREIIPYLDPVVLEDLTTQIRFTLELSGIECTKLELVAKDKKGNLRSLMHFLDNKED